MHSFFLWLIEAAVGTERGGNWFTGPEFRSAALGVVITMGGFGLNLIRRVLKNVEKMCEDIHGTPERPGIFALLRNQREDIDWLLMHRRNQIVAEKERARLKRETLAVAERESFDGPEKRHHLRRDRDRIADVNQTDEFPLHPDDEKRL